MMNRNRQENEQAGCCCLQRISFMGGAVSEIVDAVSYCSCPLLGAEALVYHRNPDAARS